MLNIFELAKESYKKAQKNRENLNKVDTLLTEEDSRISNLKHFESKSKESNILICGSSNCGKSHLIARFLDLRSDSLHTPTIALDYNYSSRIRNNVQNFY